MEAADNNGQAKASREERAVSKAVRMSRLMDLYGPLLTDRQSQFMKLHYGDDLSFGEIAKEFGVSRQAVHDAVKHAEGSLEEYDRRLALSGTKAKARPAADADASPAAAAPAPVAGIEPCIRALEEIHDRLRRSGGVIYNADGLAREVGAVLDRMRELA